jgi:methyl-accepting chemotaxis protein
VDEADGRLGSELDTTTMWNEYKAKLSSTLGRTGMNPTETYTAWAELVSGAVGIITRAGDKSNLILDPDLDTFYLMDTVVVKVPAMLDAVGQISRADQPPARSRR